MNERNGYGKDVLGIIDREVMATQQSTIDYLLEQLSDLANISARKMFGEYALYCNGKVVALVCDDHLFLKPTAAGKQLLGTTKDVPPYPGAKPHYLISADLWEDQDWLLEIVERSAAELPEPKPKKKK